MKPPPARTLLFPLVAAILALTWIERYVPGVFALVLGAFALRQFWRLGGEFLSPSLSDGQLEEARIEFENNLRRASPEKRSEIAGKLSLSLETTPEEMAQAWVAGLRSSQPPYRSRVELGCEALGILGFCLLIPFAVALAADSFFGLNQSYGFGVTLAACVSLVAFALPHFVFPRDARVLRKLWWALPIIPALLVVAYEIDTQHTYLNPLHPDHARLAADRVVALSEKEYRNVLAAQYADWVLNYARQLDSKGESEAAKEYYRAALRLRPGDRKAFLRLKELEGKAEAVVESKAESQYAPFWSDGEEIASYPRSDLTEALPRIKELTIVIIPVGNIPDQMADVAASVLRKELNVPIMISDHRIALPPYSRDHNSRKQWDTTSIMTAALGDIRMHPETPVRFLVLTEADIFMEGTNFVFSANYAPGGVVSSARFGDVGKLNSLAMHRTAKQSLCMIIKTLSVLPSTDRACVTSYTRSLEEFDQKGNRPNAETLAMWKEKVAAINAAWAKTVSDAASRPR